MSATADMLPHVTLLVQPGRSTREPSTSGTSYFLFETLEGDATRNGGDDDGEDGEDGEDGGGDAATEASHTGRRVSTCGTTDSQRSSYNRVSRAEATLYAPSFSVSPAASAPTAQTQQPRRHRRGTDVNPEFGGGAAAAAAVTTEPSRIPDNGSLVAGDGNIGVDVGGGDKYDSLLERLVPASPRLRSLPRAAWLDLEAVSAAVVADLSDAAAVSAAATATTTAAAATARNRVSSAGANDGAASAMVQGGGAGSCQPTPPATPTQVSQLHALTPPPPPSSPPLPPPPQQQQQQPERQQPTVEGLARQVQGLQELVASLVGALQRTSSGSQIDSASVSATATAASPDSPVAGRHPAQRRRIGEPRSQVTRRRWAVQASSQAGPAAAAGDGAAAAATSFAAETTSRSGSMPVGAAWPLLTSPQTSLPLPETAPTATPPGLTASPLRRSAFELLASPPSFVLGTASPVTAAIAAPSAATSAASVGAAEAAADGDGDAAPAGQMSRTASWASSSGLTSRLLSSPPPPPPPRLSLPGPGELGCGAASPPPPSLFWRLPGAAATSSFWTSEEEGPSSTGTSAAPTPTAFAASARSPSFSSSLPPSQRTIPPASVKPGLREINDCQTFSNSTISRQAAEELVREFYPVSPRRQQLQRRSLKPQDPSPPRPSRRGLQQQQHSPLLPPQQQQQQRQQEAFPGAFRILRKKPANRGNGSAAGGAAAIEGSAASAGLRHSLEVATAAASARISRRVVFGDDPAFHEGCKAYNRKWQASLQESNENRWVRRLLAPDIASDPFAVAWQGASPTRAVATWATAATAAAAASTAPAAATSPTAAYAAAAAATVETPRSSTAGLCSEADGAAGGVGDGGADGGWCTPQRRAMHVEHMVDSAVEALAGLFASYGAPLGLTKLAPYTYGLDSRRLRLKMLPDGRLAVRCGSGWEELTRALAKLPLPRDSAARAAAPPSPTISPSPSPSAAAAAAAYGGAGVGFSVGSAPAAVFRWP